jgi:hypothetical protein
MDRARQEGFSHHVTMFSAELKARMSGRPSPFTSATAT